MMISLELEALPKGCRTMIDATTFVHHFTGVSAQCKRFLVRCETGDIEGVTCVTVVAEVTHRLMMIEAVQKGAVSPGNVAAKLRKYPDRVRQLELASEQATRIPLMGIKVVGLDLRLLLAAAELRRDYGLMANDSLIAATTRDSGIENIATSDADFARVDGLFVFAPTDLSSFPAR